MNPLLPPPAVRARGFSLVELMVSVVIGMLALTFATRMMLGSERNKTSSLGGSDSMQNGMLALFSITDDLNQAGFGLNDPIVVGCNTVFSDTSGFELETATRGGATIRPLAPVVIAPNAAGSDRITTYSGSSMTGTGTLGITLYGGGGSVTVDRVPYGFSRGDVILAAPDDTTAGGNCAMAQITTDPATLLPPPATQSISFAGSGRFNRGSLGATFAPNESRLFNLGPNAALSFHTWSVSNGFLMLRATDLTGASLRATTVIDNVVSLKAQYGFDTRPEAVFNDVAGVQRGGLQVNAWSSSMMDADNDGVIGDSDDYQRVAAVRVAVVSRAPAPDKPVAGVCSATPAALTVFNVAEPVGVAAVPVTINAVVTGDAVDWKCYRYRVFETIIPMRNLGWRPTATSPNQ